MKNQKKKKVKKKKITGICSALKNLNTKQIFKLLSLYQIPREHIEKEKENYRKKENEENKIIEEKKEKDEREEDKENDKEKGIENNEEKEDEDIKIEDIKKEEKIKLEYETYSKIKEIFTILSLIGCEILTFEEEEKINKELNEKIVKNGFLTKNDFIEYNFWFEKYFEYQNNINEENDEWFLETNKDKKMNIKELIFEIWKDDTGNNININQFLLILKIGN